MVMAHRGDCLALPENSLPAFRQACELDIDCLETDAHLTRDGEIVFFHDYCLERVTTATGKVAQLSLKELKRLDIGDRFQAADGSNPYKGKGLQIQTMEEVMSTFTNIKFNIDIKSFNVKAPFILAKKLKALGAENRVMVGSFLQWQLYLFRRVSDAPTSAGPLEIISFLTRARLNRSFNAPYYALQVPVKVKSLPIVTRETVRFAHDNNIAIHVWTINKKEQMKELLRLGVDGIFTDDPLLLLEVESDLGYPVRINGARELENNIF